MQERGLTLAIRLLLASFWSSPIPIAGSSWKLGPGRPEYTGEASCAKVPPYGLGCWFIIIFMSKPIPSGASPMPSIVCWGPGGGENVNGANRRAESYYRQDAGFVPGAGTVTAR